jgi:hypothetical protein
MIEAIKMFQCGNINNVSGYLYVKVSNPLLIQSNLSTTAPLYRGGRSLEVFQSKLVVELVWPELLLTGGLYSEVAVSTGLTVQKMPLYRITLGKTQTDSINQMIIISK